MNKNPLTQLSTLGQSFWYDNIQRGMLTSGELKRMVEEDDLRGVTSNPTIFEKAIASSKDYDTAIDEILNSKTDISSRDLFFSLAVDDIRNAADILRPVYDQTNCMDGYVSLEVSPDLAHDTQASIDEALSLFKRLDRPNVMIKIPSTKEGVAAIEHLIAEGVNVNATLLFSVGRYVEVAKAYIRGLQKRHAKGLPVDKISSVASFFVSRVDSSIDKALQEHASDNDTVNEMLGKFAIANAKSAYLRYQTLFSSEDFEQLKQAGAQVQRLLWASTGTKNPEFSDVLYIDNLIGEDTVNTIPPATYKAFKDHGNAHISLTEQIEQADAMIEQVAKMGVDIPSVMQKLEDDGVASFAQSFDNLLNAIDEKADQIRQRRSSAA